MIAALAMTLSLLAPSAPAQQPDRYRSFAELAQNEREGVDYSVTARDLRSPVTVLAIHGGTIDAGSERLAASLAGDDWSFYLFRGLRRSHDLHLTAARFDEPRALALVAGSRTCLSVHSHRAYGPRICVGGGDSALRARMAAALRTRLGPVAPEIAVQTSCPGLDGVAQTNIVNRCPDKGVQLEFSHDAIRRIGQSPTLWQTIRGTIRGLL